MQLKEFIYQKKIQLEQEYGKGRVNLKDAESVALNLNGFARDFASQTTNPLQEGTELKDLRTMKKQELKFGEHNGTYVIFEVLPPRKRKPVEVTYYFLWKNN